MANKKIEIEIDQKLLSEIDNIVAHRNQHRVILRHETRDDWIRRQLLQGVADWEEKNVPLTEEDVKLWISHIVTNDEHWRKSLWDLTVEAKKAEEKKLSFLISSDQYKRVDAALRATMVLRRKETGVKE